MSTLFSDRFKSKIKGISILLFIIYLMVLAYLLFFSSEYGRTANYVRNNNFTPFETIGNFIKYREYVSEKTFMINIIGNVVAFMPMGFFVPILFRRERSAISVILVSAMISMLVELSQYYFRVGAFDVDDIILNTIGGFVGYIVFFVAYIIYHFFKKKVSKSNVK